ncbi:unnamed protein product [Gemmataceae bacterium]|nr:unnamed protein product [Gemmataceae bacterium]VTT97884.1 unnamed protein product [Gemmataceae bacterium]
MPEPMITAFLAGILTAGLPLTLLARALQGQVQRLEQQSGLRRLSRACAGVRAGAAPSPVDSAHSVS